MKAFVPFLVFPLFLSSLAAQEPKKDQSAPGSLTDEEAIQAYEDTILQNLKDGQYDVLEDQFEEVQDRSVQLQDGTPKIWAYFRAFDLGDEAKHKTLDDIKALAQRVRTWRDNRPNSVAALLTLANALTGKANKIRQQSKEEHFDLSDPKIKKTLQEPLTEAAKIIFTRINRFQLFNFNRNSLRWLCSFIATLTISHGLRLKMPLIVGYFWTQHTCLSTKKP